jgi:hypothetical protein
MTARTRYFVIASLLVLVVGLGTGAVVYYLGVPSLGLFARTGPAELRYLPRDSAVVAYANVRNVMASAVRQKIHQALPEDGQREFQNQTGIDIEKDIDRVVASFRPQDGGNSSGLVLARGRFDAAKIEALMRGHGAEIEEFHGKRLISAHPQAPPADGFALSFIEPGLAALGSTAMVRGAIDQQSTDNVTANAELMDLVRGLNSGDAWAVGRFDVLRRDAHLPEAIASQIPAITWFSVSSSVDTAIHGAVRADARDEEAANNLRDVVRGFLALARLQSGSRPEFRALAQSLELGGTGKTVTLSFTVPSEVFESAGRMPR